MAVQVGKRLRRSPRKRQTKRKCYGAFGNGEIRLDRLNEIELNVKERAAGRRDLKQAQEDFDAGHITVVELHRIQREVGARQRATSP